MSAKSMQINIFHCLPIFTPERRRENVNSGENENTRNRRDHVVPPSGADGGRFFVPKFVENFNLSEIFLSFKEMT